MFSPGSVGGDEFEPTVSSSRTARCGSTMPAVRTWLFPVDGAQLLDNWDPIGLRGTASESYPVEDLLAT